MKTWISKIQQPAAKLFSGLMVMSLSFCAMANGDGHPSRLDVIESQLEESTRNMKILAEEIKALKRQRTDMSAANAEQDFINGFDIVKDWREHYKLGGYIHTVLTHINGENGDATSFNRLRLGTYLKIKFSEKLMGFAEFDVTKFIATDDAFAGNREKPFFAGYNETANLRIAWLEYAFSQLFKLKVGRFINPHAGVFWTEGKKPIPQKVFALILDPERPMMYRPFASDAVFPIFAQGAQLHGSKNLNDNSTILYAIYGGHFRGNADDLTRGIRIAHLWEDPELEVGLNYFEGDRDGLTSDNYKGYGFDVNYARDKFFFRSEFYRTEENTDRVGLALKDRLAYYVQPAYWVRPDVAVFYRYDFFNNGQRVGNFKEHVFGANWFIQKNVILRYVAKKKDFEASETGGVPGSNAWLHQLSATAFF